MCSLARTVPRTASLIEAGRQNQGCSIAHTPETSTRTAKPGLGRCGRLTCTIRSPSRSSFNALRANDANQNWGSKPPPSPPPPRARPARGVGPWPSSFIAMARSRSWRQPKSWGSHKDVIVSAKRRRFAKRRRCNTTSRSAFYS